MVFQSTPSLWNWEHLVVDGIFLILKVHPWIAGGQLHTYLWFSRIYPQLLNTPFSPALIFPPWRGWSVSPGLHVKTARRQPSAHHKRGSHRESWECVLGGLTFVFMSTRGKAYPPVYLKLPYGPPGLLLLIWISFICGINKRVQSRPQWTLVELQAVVLDLCTTRPLFLLLLWVEGKASREYQSLSVRVTSNNASPHHASLARVPWKGTLVATDRLEECGLTS